MLLGLLALGLRNLPLLVDDEAGIALLPIPLETSEDGILKLVVLLYCRGRSAKCSKNHKQRFGCIKTEMLIRGYMVTYLLLELLMDCIQCILDGDSLHVSSGHF